MNATDRTGLIAVLLFAVAVVFLSRGDNPSDRLDVAVVGDSFAQQSGDQLLALADDLDMRAEVFAFGGSSICGWRGQLEELAEREPERLVLSFAGNDVDECINPHHLQRTPEEVAEIYRADLDWVVEQFRSAGTDLYLVAPPPIQDPAFEANAAAMRDMYTRFSVEHPAVTVIETFEQLGPDHRFHDTLPCRADEPCDSDNRVALRQDDGIHLTPEGGKRYAQAIMAGVSGPP